MTSYGYRNRPVPKLPDPKTLPFPANIIRQCSECNIRSSCKSPVPGEGATPAQVMLIGQNPGWNEDQYGRPFIGQAGQYLDSLLFQCSIPRETIYIANLIKCLTPGNRVPTPQEIQACSRWLKLELELVDPDIIVAMGAPAIYNFMGHNAGTVEHLHGKPVELEIGGRNRILLPSYHPAAALHDTAKLRQCQEDFRVLRGLIKGNSWTEYHVKDAYPNPDYRVADTPAKLKQMRDEIHDSGEYAIDTEQCRGKLWSVQISAVPGTAWFIPVKDNHKGRYDLTMYDALAIVHFYLHDIQWVNLREDKFTDTMVLAYLTGQSQGLKELASRLCGISMITYSEIVRPGQQILSMEYLEHAADLKWSDPPEVTETKWDNKKGGLITKAKHPWHINRKITKLLNDITKDSNTDPWDRWRSIPQLERDEVEASLGSMPESSLIDIPFEDAVQYASRDADATLRAYYRLKRMVVELGLEFVLQMDINILPMVDAMMKKGLAVDLEHFRNLSEEYDVKMRVKALELGSLIGHSFNPNSRPQVATVVYRELGFTPTGFTPTKEISTDDQELKKTNHPVAKGVIEYRRLSKMKGTYADALIEWSRIDSEGTPRIHTTLKTTRTETGRLASADPNLQNIPTRSKEGKLIKLGFIAPKGWKLGEGDLGQIELCTQAHLARCLGLIELFNRGGDPHTETASRIFGVSLEEAKKDKYRYPCKRAGFGIIYMIGPRGLSNQITEYIADLVMDGEAIDMEPWTEDDCARFITDYYQLYPEIKVYQQEMASMARRYGYVQDMFGRIRYVPEVSCPIRSVEEAGLRQAANMPVTSSAQGIIKLAMGQLWRDLPKTEWADKVKWLMQIHDSLLIEVVDDDDVIKPYLKWMQDVMCGVVKLLVPVRVDFKVGQRWGELEKYKL